MPMSQPARPHVVIVGVGFGGLACARRLAGIPARVTLIDRRNYHLFQPLLYQVATAALSPADIAWPIRATVRGQKNTAVQLGRVTGVDPGAREVIVDDQRRVPYDYLVLATGARHSYFGRDEWEGVAPGLKKIDDATLIRQRVLIAFERAEVVESAVERDRLLTFVVIGGGPTGVEMAGAIAELARHALVTDFRTIDSREARVVLVEAGPRLLAAFPEALSAEAKTGAGGARRGGPPGQAGDRLRRGRGRRRRRAAARRHHRLGRRRHGLAGRQMARRRGRPGGAHQGHASPRGAGPRQCLRDRRHGAGAGRGRSAGAGGGACREADGCLCRQA